METTVCVTAAAAVPSPTTRGRRGAEQSTDQLVVLHSKCVAV